MRSKEQIIIQRQLVEDRDYFAGDFCNKSLIPKIKKGTITSSEDVVKEFLRYQKSTDGTFGGNDCSIYRVWLRAWTTEPASSKSKNMNKETMESWKKARLLLDEAISMRPNNNH